MKNAETFATPLSYFLQKLSPILFVCFSLIPVICLGLHYFTCANTSILLHINVRRIINAGSTGEEKTDL